MQQCILSFICHRMGSSLLHTHPYVLWTPDEQHVDNLGFERYLFSFVHCSPWIVCPPFLCWCGKSTNTDGGGQTGLNNIIVLLLKELILPGACLGTRWVVINFLNPYIKDQFDPFWFLSWPKQWLSFIFLHEILWLFVI